MARLPRFCILSIFYPPYSFGGDAIVLQHGLIGSLATRLENRIAGLVHDPQPRRGDAEMLTQAVARIVRYGHKRGCLPPSQRYFGLPGKLGRFRREYQLRKEFRNRIVDGDNLGDAVQNRVEGVHRREKEQVELLPAYCATHAPEVTQRASPVGRGRLDGRLPRCDRYNFRTRGQRKNLLGQ